MPTYFHQNDFPEHELQTLLRESALQEKWSDAARAAAAAGRTARGKGTGARLATARATYRALGGQAIGRKATRRSMGPKRNSPASTIRGPKSYFKRQHYGAGVRPMSVAGKGPEALAAKKVFNKALVARNKIKFSLNSIVNRNAGSPKQISNYKKRLSVANRELVGLRKKVFSLGGRRA
jgi:hypothetical protein